MPSGIFDASGPDNPGGQSSGGIISISVTSPDPLDISRTQLKADSRGFGFGGEIYLDNNGIGGITIGDPGNLSVKAFASHGGTIALNSNAANAKRIALSNLGPIRIDGGLLSADGDNLAGCTGCTGGSVIFYASDLEIGGTGPLVLSAGASGDGRGGRVAVATNGNLQIGTSDHMLQAFTRTGITGSPGFIGSDYLNAGTIEISTGGNLIVHDLASLSAGSSSLNGSGATYKLIAGTAGEGNIIFDQAGQFDARGGGVDGQGIGHGGVIWLKATSSQALDISRLRLLADAGKQTTADENSILNLFAGTGGQLEIVNKGNGGIIVGDPSHLSVSATNGYGGVILIAAGSSNYEAGRGRPAENPPSGPIFIDGGTLSSQGNGSVQQSAFDWDCFCIVTGNNPGDGGQIILHGSSLNITDHTGALILNAGASSSIYPEQTKSAGQRGFISVTTTAGPNTAFPDQGSLTIGNLDMQLVVSIVGNDPSTFNGNGKGIEISAGGNLTVDAAQIFLSPTQALPNLSGVSVRLHGGTAGEGTMTLSGILDVSSHGAADFAGPMKSGTVVISGNSSLHPVTISGTIRANGQAAGSFAVDGLGPQTTISVTNDGSAGIVLSGTLEASASDSTGGVINLNGWGEMDPRVNASARPGSVFLQGAKIIATGKVFDGEPDFQQPFLAKGGGLVSSR